MPSNSDDFKPSHIYNAGLVLCCGLFIVSEVTTYLQKDVNCLNPSDALQSDCRGTQYSAAGIVFFGLLRGVAACIPCSETKDRIKGCFVNSYTRCRDALSRLGEPKPTSPEADQYERIPEEKDKPKEKQAAATFADLDEDDLENPPPLVPASEQRKSLNC